MSVPLPAVVTHEVALEEAHFSQAPAAFFHAWRRGVRLAGIELFGNGTEHGFAKANNLSDLRPRLMDINDAIRLMSASQKVFLAAMVSFDNPDEGAVLLRRVEFHGLSNFGRLGLEQRRVLTALILNYTSR